ncbi:hypothetical protein EGI24_20715 [Lacihabitans sp. CS3-21]|nr:hypothetical protein [Lacihabitans sp. CS3-21]
MLRLLENWLLGRSFPVTNFPFFFSFKKFLQKYSTFIVTLFNKWSFHVQITLKTKNKPIERINRQ